jgi:hypothetical protein
MFSGASAVFGGKSPITIFVSRSVISSTKLSTQVTLTFLSYDLIIKQCFFMCLGWESIEIYKGSFGSFHLEEIEIYLID